MDRDLNKDSPLFEHDCTSCEFHGTLIFQDVIYDLYRCGSTLITRHSSKHSDYSSCLMSCVGPLSNFGLQILKKKLLVGHGVDSYNGSYEYFIDGKKINVDELIFKEGK